MRYVIAALICVALGYGCVKAGDDEAQWIDQAITRQDTFIAQHGCKRTGYAGKYAEYQVFTCADGSSYKRAARGSGDMPGSYNR